MSKNIKAQRARRIRKCLHILGSRYLWMAIPKMLEDEIVKTAIETFNDEDIDCDYHGCLFELAVEMAADFHGFGVFATVYDELVIRAPSSGNALGVIDKIDDDTFNSFCIDGYIKL